MSKSVSNSTKVKYRLSRTLRRQVSYRDFEEDDLKYLWASMKMSNKIPEDITPAEFHVSAVDGLQHNYQWAWTILYNNRPIGIVTAIETHSFKHVVDVEWFSWATLRNQLEGALLFASKIRHKYVLTAHIPRSNIRFLEHMAKYGMISRVGTLYGIIDEPLAFFQTFNRLK